MKIGARGLAILKHYEQGPNGGVALQAYLCPAKVWTIGWGHTKGVKKGDTCTELQADRWLDEDCDEAEAAVERYVVVPLNQNQFDALVCFVFNIGVGSPAGGRFGASGFRGSTMLMRLNAGLYTEAAGQFPRWNKSNGKVLEGLTKRRYKERDLFLTPVP